MLKNKLLNTPEEVKVFVDPFRYKIYEHYSNKGEPATVKEIADEMGEVPAKVSYHVKKMEKVGILQLVYTKEINGIVAKYYEPTAEDFEIQCSSNDGHEKKAVLAQAEQFVSDFYDDTKKIVLNEMKRHSNRKGHIYAQELYFTEEEMDQILENISEVFKKRKKKSKGSEDKKKYHCLVSIMELDSNSKK